MRFDGAAGNRGVVSGILRALSVGLFSRGRKPSRASRGRCVGLVVVALAALGLVPSAASAAPQGIAGTFGSQGITGKGGEFANPRGVAVNEATGDVYMVDVDSQRVERFSAGGVFERAWGKDVVIAGRPGDAGTGFEICSGAEDCKLGVAGGLGGEFSFAASNENDGAGIAIDQASGAVYVSERGGRRVQQFTADGAFVRAWGRDVVRRGGVGDVPSSEPAVDEQQTILLQSPGGSVTGGTFTLSFAGQTTAPIAYNASAATVDTALESLSSIAAGDVAVTGADGGMWTVTFTGALGGSDVAQMTGNGSGLTGTGLFGSVLVSTIVSGGTPLDRFEVCSVAADCQGGVEGSQGGEFGSDLNGRLAVVPAGAPNAGNVVVGDARGLRVQEFDPDAGSAAGVFVRAFGWDVVQAGGTGDDSVGTPNEFEICTVAAECKAGSSGSGVGQFGVNGPARVAVDSTGAVYAVDPAAFRVLKFSPQAGPPALAAGVFAAASIPAASATAPRDVVVDSSDRVFVLRSFAAGASICPTGSSSVAEVRALELTTAGVEVADSPHFACAGLPLTGGARGMAVNAVSGEMYLTSTSPESRMLLSGITSLPTMSMGVSVATNHTVELVGLVNPNGPGGANGVRTTYRFEYWKTSNPGVVTVGSENSVGNGTAPVPVSLQVTGLEANTEYAARLVVTKPFMGGDVQTPAQTFTTTVSRPDAIAGVSDRTPTSATLTARINPNNSATSYRFQYGTTAGYGSEVPVPDGSVGSGASEVMVSEEVVDLAPATTYHFRVVATNAHGTTTTQDRTFTTEPVPGPDGRAYELVSPAYKVGGAGVGRWTDLALEEAGFPAHEGDRFAVQGTWGSMLLDGSMAYANDWAFADRTSEGWVSHSPFTRVSAYGSHSYRFVHTRSAADDLSTISWNSNTGLLRMFPEQESWGPSDTAFASDWEGNWEVVAPTSSNQGLMATSGVAAGGGHVAVVLEGGFSEGLSPGDPYLDVVSNKQRTYVDDVSQGLSNTFPGDGVRSAVGVCTGSGTGRTQIPARDGAGKAGSVTCPAAPVGRDAALISTGGATLGNASAGIFGGGAQAGSISRAGDRVFFMSPDRVTTPCLGTGASTSCPTQAYVYQRGIDGTVTTRWVSRSTVDGQDASLIGPAYFQGASETGDRVFFQTNSPLTADDPNAGPQVPGGVKSGSVHANSWDLYRYDVPSGANGRPGAADPGDGTLVRISAGPTGTGDCNVMPARGNIDQSLAGSLRFASEDGDRVYFTCAAPLAGVPAPTNGTTTTPAGTAGDRFGTNPLNLYLYDANRPVEQRWEFVARIPRQGGADSSGSCAVEGIGEGDAIGDSSYARCVEGTADGSFITFFTNGQLTADDPDATSLDVYGFDATAGELVRITAAQGGAGGTYTCSPAGVATALACHGSPGDAGAAVALRPLTVATDPGAPGQRTVFFESGARLVAEDVNDVMDVYQWRDGDLSLVSSGAADGKGSYYKGNDRTGRNVYFATKDVLTWQDVDAVADVYVARVGGGFEQPEVPEACDVLGDACQGGGAGSVAVGLQTGSPVADGNVGESVRKTLVVSALSAKARRKASRSGVLRLSVRTSAAGKVSAVAKGRIGSRTRRVAGKSVRAAKAGKVTLKLRLNRAARRRLAAGRSLALTVQVSSPGARARTSSVRLPGASS